MSVLALILRGLDCRPLWLAYKYGTGLPSISAGMLLVRQKVLLVRRNRLIEVSSRQISCCRAR